VGERGDTVSTGAEGGKRLCVVALALADLAEMFPAASYAATVKEYDVRALREVTEYDVVALVATSDPFS
jgi:hypothetical protein